jgi:FK506-binding nuclear protein
MSSLLPLASYNLALEPFVPTQAIDSDLPVTVHLTLAALDPNAIDDEEQPSTLRILKSSPLSRLLDEDEDEEEDDDIVDIEAEDDEEEDDDEEDEEKDEGDEDGDDEEDSEDDLDDDVEEFVVCTLSPKSQYQQTLDITISPDEEIFFVVTGSYPIHLTGNFVEHPYDGEDSDDFDSEDDEEDDSEFDSDEYDLTPDEDELAEEDFDINDLEDEEDIEAKIEELVEEEEKKQESKKENKKSKKENKKRQVEEEEEQKPETETKKQKKEKKEKAVQFNKELEQGPTQPEKKKPAVKTLAGGVTIEDRTVGKGPAAKNGSKVGVRYIGKLKNGSVFDKNTSGKPFQFGLGKGEVIKGWDIGVAGMAVGGERRIVIPAPYAYGKKKLPGIPANSELTFDVKLVSLK